MQKKQRKTTDQLEFTLSPPEKDQAALLAAIEQFGIDHGFLESFRYRLGLIVDELVTNSTVHGTCIGAGQTVKVNIAVHDNDLVIEIVDTGLPFDPTTHPLQHCCPQDGPVSVGGAGLSLVRRLADQIHYSRSNDHNHLVITLNTVKKESACSLKK